MQAEDLKEKLACVQRKSEERREKMNKEKCAVPLLVAPPAVTVRPCSLISRTFRYTAQGGLSGALRAGYGQVQVPCMAFLA